MTVPACLPKKRLNSSGFAHLILLLAVIVVVAVAGIGTVVYKYHKAHAGGWMYLDSYRTRQGDVSFYACKRVIAAYGGVYQVTVQYRKPANLPAYQFALSGYRPSKPLYIQSDWHQTSTYYANRTTGQLTINLSAPLGDEYGAGMPSTGYVWRKPAGLPNC